MNAFSALPGGRGEAMDTVHRSCRHFLILERELSDPSQWPDGKRVDMKSRQRWGEDEEATKKDRKIKMCDCIFN